MKRTRLAGSTFLVLGLLAGGSGISARAEVDGYLPRPLPKTSYIDTLEQAGVPRALVDRLDRNGRRNLRRLVRVRADDDAARALQLLPRMTADQFPEVALILNNPKRLKVQDVAQLVHALGDSADSIETAQRHPPQP